MPPQTDKLSILRAVLANLAGRGAIPTDAFGQTALGGSNSPSSMATPSGFDATMRGVRLPQEPGFDATMRDVRLPEKQAVQADPSDILRANVPSGDWYQNTPSTATRDTDGVYGRTALGGNVLEGNWQWTSPTTQSKTNDDGSKVTRTVKGKSSPKSGDKFISNKMESDMVTAPTRQSQSSSKPSASAGTKSTQSKQSSSNTQSSSPASSQSSKGSESGKSTPVAQAEPSGEALSFFRKNKQSAGWDALGTAVSLVQSSLKPEKGGLKSRAEYDRLLRGSDNFKKLDGDEQQRVRQAFAQWMNEQTIFKGKA